MITLAFIKGLSDVWASLSSKFNWIFILLIFFRRGSNSRRTVLWNANLKISGNTLSYSKLVRIDSLFWICYKKRRSCSLSSFFVIYEIFQSSIRKCNSWRSMEKTNKLCRASLVVNDIVLLWLLDLHDTSCSLSVYLQNIISKVEPKYEVRRNRLW